MHWFKRRTKHQAPKNTPAVWQTHINIQHQSNKTSSTYQRKSNHTQFLNSEFGKRQQNTSPPNFYVLQSHYPVMYPRAQIFSMIYRTATGYRQSPAPSNAALGLAAIHTRPYVRCRRTVNTLGTRNCGLTFKKTIAIQSKMFSDDTESAIRALNSAGMCTSKHWQRQNDKRCLQWVYR